jgi:hypothetical protein
MHTMHHYICIENPHQGYSYDTVVQFWQVTPELLDSLEREFAGGTAV